MEKLLKKINKYLRKNEGTDAARILGELLAALDTGSEFRLVGLYGLPYEAFELALHLLKEWRLASYTSKLGDLPNAMKMAAMTPDVNWLSDAEARSFDSPAVEQ